MLLSVVGACTQIPSDVILPRGRRNHVSPHTRLTMVLFILIPKQITGVAIPLLHGAVVITSETTTTSRMQDRVATICASNIVIFPAPLLYPYPDCLKKETNRGDCPCQVPVHFLFFLLTFPIHTFHLKISDFNLWLVF